MIKFFPHRSLARAAAGFSLVEVALALGIAAFALVAIFGLLPIGINSNRAAVEQTAALNIATAIVTDLRVTDTTNIPSVSPSLAISIPAPTANYPTLDTNSTTTLYLDESARPCQVSASRYRATINFAVPPTGQRPATLAKIILSWPGAALPANAAGSVTNFVALDRN